jgi:hypothetical protein
MATFVQTGLEDRAASPKETRDSFDYIVRFRIYIGLVGGHRIELWTSCL